MRLADAIGVPDGGGCHPGSGLAGPAPRRHRDVDGRAVVPGLRLGHSVRVQAGQRRCLAAALLLQHLELVLGLVELAAQVGLVAHDLVQFVTDRQAEGLVSLRNQTGVTYSTRLRFVLQFCDLPSSEASRRAPWLDLTN
jgi:hypothetical protein